MTPNQGTLFPDNYYGAPNDYTDIFIVWELISQSDRTSVTQGFLAGILLCNLHKVLSVNTPITHINCLELIFNYTHTPLLDTKKIVSELFV